MNEKLWGRVIDEPLFLADVLYPGKEFTPIHEKWIREIWDPGDSILLAHRNSYKTTCRIISIIWGLLFKPETRILIIRKSDKLAQSILQSILNHYNSENFQKLHISLFGISQPYDDKMTSIGKGINVIHKQSITNEHNVEYCGIGKARTGSHYDIILPDDIVTRDDRYYTTERNNTKLFVEDFHNLLNVGNSAVKYSGTPWHHDDVFTKLEKDGNTKISKYPVRMKFIPEFDDTKIQDLKGRMTNSLFAANYDLKHISDEELIFSDPQYVDELPQGKYIAYLDPACGGKDSSAMAVGCIYMGKLYIKYAWAWHSPLGKSYDIIIKNYIKSKAVKLYIEDNSAQKAILDVLRERGLDPGGVTNILPKHLRINKYLVKNWKKVYFSRECQEPFMEQILNYEEPMDYASNIKKAGVLYDAPDCMAGLIKKLGGETLEQHVLL